MPKKLVCPACKTTMRVAYVRLGKTWKRVAWACPRCGHVESGMVREFRPHRKANPFYGNP